jgi:hypothetical protein
MKFCVRNTLVFILHKRMIDMIEYLNTRKLHRTTSHLTSNVCYAFDEKSKKQITVSIILFLLSFIVDQSINIIISNIDMLNGHWYNQIKLNNTRSILFDGAKVCSNYTIWFSPLDLPPDQSMCSQKSYHFVCKIVDVDCYEKKSSNLYFIKFVLLYLILDVWVL